MSLPEWAKWMARDNDGTLWVYSKKPEKYEDRDEWYLPAGVGKFDYIDDLSELNFPHIKWLDEEPTEVINMMTNHTQKGVEFDPIEPEHYNKGEIDLFEAAYRTRPFTEVRAILEFTAERYFKRDKQNRIEDIDKGIYVMRRLRAYEVLESEKAKLPQDAD